VNHVTCRGESQGFDNEFMRGEARTRKPPTEVYMPGTA